jgi:hypothetical protein
MRRTAQEMNKFEPRNPSVEGGLRAMTSAFLPHCECRTAAEMPAPPVWRRASRADNARVASRRSADGPSRPPPGLTHHALENAHGIV